MESRAVQVGIGGASNRLRSACSSPRAVARAACRVVLVTWAVLCMGALGLAQGVPKGPAKATARTGVLAGRVETSTQQPVAGARLKLSNGQQAQTDGAGNFRLEGVPAGVYQISIQCKGYKPASGQTKIEAGQDHRLLVALTPLPGTAGPPPPKKVEAKPGTLYIEAYTIGSGNTRGWVRKLEVWEWGNASKYWTTYWTSDAGDTYRSLPCKGTTVGKIYEIRVTWAVRYPNGGLGTRTGQYQKKVFKESQTERFYRP